MSDDDLKRGFVLRISPCISLILVCFTIIAITHGNREMIRHKNIDTQRVLEETKREMKVFESPEYLEANRIYELSQDAFRSNDWESFDFCRNKYLELVNLAHKKYDVKK